MPRPTAHENVVVVVEALVAVWLVFIVVVLVVVVVVEILGVVVVGISVVGVVVAIVLTYCSSWSSGMLHVCHVSLMVFTASAVGLV